jgi:hypothetical protein
VFVKADGTVAGSAEGWNPAQWRDVSASLAKVLSWSKPELPHPKDPRPFAGSPA